MRRIEMQRCVQSEVVPDLEVIRELRVEADAIEARYGSNAYSSYLRKHGRRPNREDAAAIGRYLGSRVRAEDGSMQPSLTAADRHAIEKEKAEREAFALRCERITGLKSAIATFAEIERALIGNGRALLDDPDLVALVGDAVELAVLIRGAVAWPSTEVGHQKVGRDSSRSTRNSAATGLSLQK
jgi:hypothetical protein